MPGGEIDYTKPATQAEKDAIKKRCVRVHLHPLPLLLAASVVWPEAMFVEGRLLLLDIWLTILQIRQSQVRGEILESICRMAGARRLGGSSLCLAGGSQADVEL